MLRRCATEKSASPDGVPSVSGICVTPALSLLSVAVTHLTLALVAFLFHVYPLPFQLLLSATVLLISLVLQRSCRKLAGVRASALCSVFFHIFLSWAVYVTSIRHEIPWYIDAAINGELCMLVTGVYCVASIDPGFVEVKSMIMNANGDVDVGSDDSHCTKIASRTRYCRSCKAYVKGFDHHCPAFGNCIGEKNYALFFVVLIGFLCTEATYVLCSFKFLERFAIQPSFTEVLVISTTQFNILQVLWQGVFLVWHVHCVCFNIRTDEWINWKNYQEFHHNDETQTGGYWIKNFRNPYDKGVLGNVSEFFRTRR